MRYHYADGIHPVECPGSHGRRCRICELTDPTHPDHDPAYLALYTDGPTGPAEVPSAHGLPLAGDLLAMVLRWVGVAWLVERWAERTCRCASRQERLNRLDARLRRWLGMG
jgi:hypothetical protein